jgi:hypothetical protein
VELQGIVVLPAAQRQSHVDGQSPGGQVQGPDGLWAGRLPTVPLPAVPYWLRGCGYV